MSVRQRVGVGIGGGAVRSGVIQPSFDAGVTSGGRTGSVFFRQPVPRTTKRASRRVAGTNQMPGMFFLRAIAAIIAFR